MPPTALRGLTVFASLAILAFHGAAAGSGAACTHTIGDGELLQEIAAAAELTIGELLGINPGLGDPTVVIEGPAGLVLHVPCGALPGAQQQQQQYASLVDVLRHRSNTKLLLQAVKAAGLEEALSDGRKATLFAPNDNAFKALLHHLNTTASELFVNIDLLSILLDYHVVPSQAVLSSGIKQDQAETLDTALSGATLNVTTHNGTLLVYTAAGQHVHVVDADLMAGAGVVQVVDQVLLPHATSAASSTTTANGTAAAAAAAAPAGAPACTYTVQNGDTLFELAQRFLTTVAALESLNPGITDPSFIVAGTTLNVGSGCTSAGTAAPAPSAEAGIKPNAGPVMA